MMDSAGAAAECAPSSTDGGASPSSKSSTTASLPSPVHDRRRQHPSSTQPHHQPHHAAAAHNNHAPSSHHGHHHEEAEMRESDGDILEAGMAPQPDTPVLSSALPSPVLRRGSGGDNAGGNSSVGDRRPQSSSSPEPLPLLPEAAVVASPDGGIASVDVLRRAGDGSCLSDLSSSSALGDSGSGSLHRHRSQAGSDVGVPIPPLPPYRRALSGDDTSIPTFGSAPGPAAQSSSSALSGDGGGGEASVATDDGSAVPTGGAPSGSGADDENDDDRVRGGGDPPLRPSAQSCRENPAEAMHHPSRALLSRSRRSKSVDRRLHEAAQFAEAVGEVPPADESELKFIIEEDGGSSDDSDDDDIDDDGIDDQRSAAAVLSVAGGEAEDDELRIAQERPEEKKEAELPVQERRQKRQEEREETREEEGGVAAADAVVVEQPREPRSPFAAKVRTFFGTGGGDSSVHSAGAVMEGNGIAPPPLSEEDVASVERREKQQQQGEANRISGQQQQGVRRPRHLLLTKAAPSSTSGAGSRHHLTLLRSNSSGPNGVRNHPSTQPYVYKGICSNPPEVTKRGISRGNYAQLHRKAWLEVSDKYHRYGKNLRLYYKHWESLGHPTNMFFDWLDSKGEAAGQPLPNLPECPRSELDSDTVLYVTNPEVQERYLISIVRTDDDDESPEGGDETDSSGGGGGGAILVDADGVPVWTGPDGWIFVLRDHALYGGQKVTSIAGKSKQRFHHSSFFGGKAVAAAGILITDESGRLLRLYPHSGHYRPTEAHMQRMLYFLQQGGFDLTTFEVDTQQILHVSRTLRDTPKGGVVTEEQAAASPVVENGANNGSGEAAKAAAAAAAAAGAATKKCKKIQSLHLKPALYVACLLAHKARMIGEGVFSQIHKIRTEGATSVSEALDVVDGGGYWKNVKNEAKENEIQDNE